MKKSPSIAVQSASAISFRKDLSLSHVTQGLLWAILIGGLGTLLWALWMLSHWQPIYKAVDRLERPLPVKAQEANADLALPTGTPTQVAISNKIPILMYHYIRDYQNPKDQLGTNLSVAPATFERQLSALKTAGYTTITFNELNQPLPNKPIILTFDDGYADAYSAALPALQAQQMKGVFYIVTHFINTPRYVTGDEVKALDQAGMEIGSHTLTHHDLSKLSQSQQQVEISQSKTELEQLLGKPVLAFCYPSGKYTAQTAALTQTAGYTSATTTSPGISLREDISQHPFELKRVRVSNSTDLLKVLGR